MSDALTKSSLSLSDVQATMQKKVSSMNGLKDQKLWKASREFEGMFMDIVMKSMRSSAGMESDVMGDSDQVKMFQEMLDTEFSKQAGDKGRFGLADAIYRQFSRQQVNADRIAAEEKAKK